MNQNWKGFLSGVLVSVLFVGLIGTAAATVGKRTVDADYNNIKVTLNGLPVDLVDANGNAVEPFAISGTTYLPVRAVASALGLNVNWNQLTTTVELSAGGNTGAESTQGGFDAKTVADHLEVKPYTWTHYSTRYLALEVTNTSSYTVDLSGNVVFLDSAGGMVGSKNDSESVIPPGKQTVLVFDNDEDYTNYTYTLEVSQPKYYAPVTQNITLQHNILTDKVVVAATNTGTKTAEFVRVTALFFKNGQVVDVDYSYCTDDDSELKPNATRTCELYCYEDFDAVQLYVAGRGNK